MTDSVLKVLSKKIAKDILKIGDAPDSKARRVQFMTGEYLHNEKPNGGLCEAALAERIEISLRKYISI